MEGGLSGLGTWELAAAVCEAGAHGSITAAVYRTPEGLREAIQNLRKATKHKFSVNLTIGMCPRIDEMLDVCIEENVHAIETAAYKPDEYAKKIKKAGIIWIHKAAVIDHLKHAERLGADAVVLVGLEGYGFKNIRQLPTFTAIAWGARQLKVPLVAGGGIGGPHTFLAALALGAEGIYMGTAFLVTKECPLSQRVKENIVKATPDHPDLIFELIAPPDPEEYKAVREAKDKMPLEKWLAAMERVHLKHKDWRNVLPMWEQGEQLRTDKAEEAMPTYGSRPKGPYSFACGYLNKIVSCKELIEGIVKGAEEILKKWVVDFKLNE